MSTFEDWATRLRISWMGEVAQRIFGGFGAMGDKATLWAKQANFEHMPEKAEDVQSLALIGSERILPQGPYESEATYRVRLTQAIPQWRYAGRPLGLLMALHYAGFENAVIVTQNGRAFQLDDPGPIDPTQTITTLGTNPTLDDHPWWTFDLDDEWCSRFAVLFTASPAFTTWAKATFTNTDEATATWNNPFDDATYKVLMGPAATTGAPPFLQVSAKTASAVTVAASGPFTGEVLLLGYPTGSNPLAWLSDEALSRLQSTVKTWRPGKATCMGVYALVQGSFIGWPIDTVGGSDTIGPSEVVMFQGA